MIQYTYDNRSIYISELLVAGTSIYLELGMEGLGALDCRTKKAKSVVYSFLISKYFGNIRDLLYLLLF